MVALYLAAEVKFMAIEFQLKAYDLWDTRGSFEKKKKKKKQFTAKSYLQWSF